MKTQKWLLPLGMIGVAAFFIHISIGELFWKGYNPITSYISELTADGAPNAPLLRAFAGIYMVCFLLFTLGMAVKAYREYRACVKIGYAMLFVITFCSDIGYGMFPMTMDVVISLQNVVHVLLTSALLCTTVLVLLLIAIGYLRKEKLEQLGRITLATGILCAVFNVWHLVAILSGQNILGLVQRLTVYTFHAFTFIISWIYTFRKTGSRPASVQARPS